MNVGPLTISAAHFIHTCDKDSPCQRLHGHNYIVNVTVSGEPDVCSCMLIDANIVKRVVDKYDHKTIVAKGCVQFDGNFVLGYSSDRFLSVVNPTTKKAYIIPESDCYIVDIPSTSAEWLAKAIARDILAVKNSVNYVEVTLSETPKLNIIARENSNRARIITSSAAAATPTKVMPTADGVGMCIYPGKFPIDNINACGAQIHEAINKFFEAGGK